VVAADLFLMGTRRYCNGGPGALGGIFVHEKHHGDGDIVKLGGWWAQKIESRFSFPVVDAVSTHSRVHSFWSLVL